MAGNELKTLRTSLMRSAVVSNTRMASAHSSANACSQSDIARGAQILIRRSLEVLAVTILLDGSVSQNMTLKQEIAMMNDRTA